MAYTSEAFIADARVGVSHDSSPTGRECVARHLESSLVGEEFVTEYLGSGKRSGAETIYTNPQADFRVLAHTNRGKSINNPHCHGPFWVIYGMVMNFVEMTEWTR